MTPELIAAVVAVLGALATYLKSRSDISTVRDERARTASVRDQDSLQLHDAVQRHEFEITRLKDEHVLHDTVLNDLRTEMSILNKNIATLTVQVEILVKTWERSSEKVIK